MRIVLNTRSDDAGSTAAIHDLGRRLQARGVAATVGDWDGYADYDVAVFMGYDHELERARAENQRIRVALVDPKQSRREWIDAARAADILFVSSVEQRDAFLRLNRNTHVFFLFPFVAAREKHHVDGEALVVGYHGNRVHLEAMTRSVVPALEALARERPVELVAVYNVEQLGRASLAPAGVHVDHVQWTPELAGLERADVGIVPSELPIRARRDALMATAYADGAYNYEPFDHLVRYKASTNPGRIYPFARFGIPVVADFVPSAAQLVEDGVSGILASSPHGWFDALDRLARSATLRASYAAQLRARVDAAYEAQLDSFLAACSADRLPPPPEIPGVTAAEEDLASGASFERPGPRTSRGSLLRRFLR